MTELKRKSDVVLETIDRQAVARANSIHDDTKGRKPVGTIVGEYDALDYRLMATFPASDATAQY